MERAWAELHVLSKNESVAARQRQSAESVFSYFEDHYSISSDTRVVCILDGQDGSDLKRELGPDNRGVHCPPWGRIYGSLPCYVRPLIGPVNQRTNKVEWPFDCIIYLHGSTCETEIGLSLCFAHELQHFMQYALQRSFYVLHDLLVELHNPEFQFMWDYPIEREARIISKRVGVELFGERAVDTHIQNRILAHVSCMDVHDWEFVRGIDLSVPYDLAVESMRLIDRHRTELVGILEKFREEKALAGVDLGRLIRGKFFR